MTIATFGSCSTNNHVDIFFLEHKSLESHECFICEFEICVKGISTSLRIFAPLRESKIISHQPFIYIFIPNGNRSERPSSPSPGQANACERHPGYPSPRTLRPKRAKARNHIAYSYRFCPFRAPSGVSSHPGCRSLRSLALGLVLLPRWGVSLQIMIRCAHTTLCSVYSRKDAKGRKEVLNRSRWFFYICRKVRDWGR